MSREILTVEVAAIQTPLETVHTKELMPLLNPVTAEALLVGVVIEAVPLRTDHKPVPAVGDTAAKVATDAQTV